MVVLPGFVSVAKALRGWPNERSTLEAMPMRKYPHPLLRMSPLTLTLMGVITWLRPVGEA